MNETWLLEQKAHSPLKIVRLGRVTVIFMFKNSLVVISPLVFLDSSFLLAAKV